MPDVLPALSERRARRAFAPTLVPSDVQETLWQAVTLAPSHGNSQPTRILVAESEPARTALVAALSDGNRGWAAAAPLLCALCAMSAHDRTQPNSDGTTRELWAFHAGIACGNLLAQATALGLTAHPMAGFDEPAVRAAFGTPPDIRVLAVVAIGYPGGLGQLPEDLRERETAQQERLTIGQVVARDHWDPEMGVSARDRRKRS